MTIEQPGEAVYVILHGTVKIHVEQSERDVILSILGTGDLLGEMSLIDSVGRSASAVTLENSLLLWMDKVTFHYILDNFTPVARNLVKILSARVRLSDQMIQALATLDVNGRVARQPLAFAEKYGHEKDGGDSDPHRAHPKRYRRPGGRLAKTRKPGHGAIQGAGVARHGCGGRISIKDRAGLAGIADRR